MTDTYSPIKYRNTVPVYDDILEVPMNLYLLADFPIYNSRFAYDLGIIDRNEI